MQIQACLIAGKVFSRFASMEAELKPSPTTICTLGLPQCAFIFLSPHQRIAFLSQAGLRTHPYPDRQLQQEIDYFL